MRIGQRKKLKFSNSQIDIQPQFQQRLFEMQSPITNQSTDLQNLKDRTHRSEFNFAEIPIFASNQSTNLPPIQTKLTIGEPRDKYEQEADTVAAQVVNQINSPQQPKAQKNDNNLQSQTAEVNSLIPLTLQREDQGIVSGEASQSFGQQLNQSFGTIQRSENMFIQRSPDKVWGMTEDSIDNLATKPKQAQKILRDDFYSNWFIAKDYLVEGKWQGKSRRTVQEKKPQFEKLMRTLLRIRKLDTNMLLMHIRDVEFAKNKYPHLKPLQPSQRLTWSAAGSETLTSDIDVNLKGEGSIPAVGLFNKLFKTKYGWPYDPGTVYDVNVYAQDFMTPGADREEAGGHIKLGKPFSLQEHGNVGVLTPIEETNEIMEDLGLSVDAFKLNQDVWSLVKMRIYMSGAEWNDYKQNILGNEMDDYAIANNPEAFARREQMEEQLLDAENCYNQYQTNLAAKVQEIENSAELVYVKMRRSLEDSGGNVSQHYQEETKNMMAANLLYEEKLERVQELRTQLKQLRAADPQQDSQIKQCALELKNALSEATIYANEAYLTQGAVHFSVVGYQIGAGIEAHKQKDNDQYQMNLNISREAHLHSMREQVGDTLKVLNEQRNAAPWKAAYKAGKYIDRLIKSARPLLSHFNLLDANFQADFEQISQIAAKATQLKANGQSSAEQRTELNPLLNGWTVANLRNIIIALGTYSERVFRPQIVN